MLLMGFPLGFRLKCLGFCLIYILNACLRRTPFPVGLRFWMSRATGLPTPSGESVVRDSALLGPSGVQLTGTFAALRSGQY